MASLWEPSQEATLVLAGQVPLPSHMEISKEWKKKNFMQFGQTGEKLNYFSTQWKLSQFREAKAWRYAYVDFARLCLAREDSVRISLVFIFSKRKFHSQREVTQVLSRC